MFALAATAAGALASASASDRAEPARRLDASAAALERLTPGQLATRLPALWMHGRARRALGRFEAALADLRRGAALAADTGRERVLLVLTIESVAPLIELGRWPRRAPRPRTGSSSRASARTRACCCGPTVHSPPRGWPRAT